MNSPCELCVQSPCEHPRPLRCNPAPIFDWDPLFSKGAPDPNLGFLIPCGKEGEKTVELYCIQSSLLLNLKDKVDLKDSRLLCSSEEVRKGLLTVYREDAPDGAYELSGLLDHGATWPKQYYDLTPALLAMAKQFKKLMWPKMIWIFLDKDDLIGIAGLLLMFLMWATQSKSADYFVDQLTSQLGLLKDELLTPTKKGLHFIRIATFYGAELHKWQEGDPTSLRWRGS